MKHNFKYTVKDLHERDLIIFSAKMGSMAYGTNISTSDVDLRGIFVQPLEDILQYGYADQVSDKLNDIVYYELGRFFELLQKNNPNILELLEAPEDCVQIKHEVYEQIHCNAKSFITKKCRFTFAGYAIEQIKKARGFNKKMNWEEASMERKTVLDFCYVLVDNDTVPLKRWLAFPQETIGLAKIDHAHDLYAMYAAVEEKWGIVSDEEKANDVQLWSIPKESEFLGHLTFNKDAYSTHCKRYNEYQTWLKERNEDRFKMNKEHGKNYDSKNMLHVFRLLKMALEIAVGELNVRRPADEIEKLLKIRHGEYEYDDLIKEAEEMIEQLDKAFDNSDLPDNIDSERIAGIELSIRKFMYGLA